MKKTYTYYDIYLNTFRKEKQQEDNDAYLPGLAIIRKRIALYILEGFLHYWWRRKELLICSVSINGSWKDRSIWKLTFLDRLRHCEMEGWTEGGVIRMEEVAVLILMLWVERRGRDGWYSEKESTAVGRRPYFGRQRSRIDPRIKVPACHGSRILF